MPLDIQGGKATIALITDSKGSARELGVSERVTRVLTADMRGNVPITTLTREDGKGTGGNRTRVGLHRKSGGGAVSGGATKDIGGTVSAGTTTTRATRATRDVAAWAGRGTRFAKGVAFTRERSLNIG